MGRACNTHRRCEDCVRNLFRNPEGQRQLEDLDVDGRLILEWILKK